MILHSLGVSIICLSKTKLHWKKNQLIQQFKSILRKALLTHKISIFISESDLPFTIDFKHGGTTLATINPISSSIISKGQDRWELGRWT